MKHDFTEKELEKLYGALWQTWCYIGGDVLACQGKNEVDRDTVLEVVLDAGRLEQFACKNERNDAEKLEITDIVKRLRKYSWEEQQEIAKGRFTCEMYC